MRVDRDLRVILKKARKISLQTLDSDSRQAFTNSGKIYKKMGGFYSKSTLKKKYRKKKQKKTKIRNYRKKSIKK